MIHAQLQIERTFSISRLGDGEASDVAW